MKHAFLHGYGLIVALCIGVVLLLPAVLDRPNYEKYLSAMQWETDGAFVANGEPSPRDFPSRVLRSPDARFWRNYTPTKGKVPAQLRSAPFVLRNNRVIIPVVGFPNSEDAGIYLESETNNQRFWIRNGGSRPQKRRSHPSWHSLPAWVSLSLRPPFYLNFCSETRLVLLILYDTSI